MNKFARRLYLDIWLIPVLILYLIKLLDSDFYSAGPALLALLISIILVLGSASIISSFTSDYIKESSFYNAVSEDKAELSNSNKIIKIQMYSHIFMIFILSATYWIHISNAEKFITH